LKYIAGLTLAVSLLCPTLFAQNAQLSGVIKDKTNAVVLGASVTLNNVDTAAISTARSNGSGFFVFPSVQPGQYSLSGEAPGFDRTLIRGIKIDSAGNVSQDIVLQIKQGAETVTVTQEAELNTTDGAVSTVITHELIENMPLNGNDLTTLFELTPGTLLNAAGGQPESGGGFSVDGQRATANYVTIDGANAGGYVPTSPPATSSNTGVGIATSASGGTNGILPIDAIEEYRMDTSTYTAENGRTPGGQIQVRTRSGTNQFHGSLFENFRNQILDAEDWFTKYDSLTQSQLRMNEFGGTLGGPVVVPHLFDGRNKLFFFVASDSLVLDEPNTAIQHLVPNASMLVGAYPTFKTWLGIFPPGNGGEDPSIPSFDYYNASYPNLIRDYTTSIRLDGQLPHSIHAFFRANIAPSSSIGVTPPIAGSGSHISLNTYTGGLTIPLGANMVDELTANYTGDNTKFLPYIASAPGSNPNGLLDNLPPGVRPSDYFDFGVYANAVHNNASVETGPAGQNELHQWNVVDIYALHKGSNTLKFGVDFLKRESILQGISNQDQVTVQAGNGPTFTDAGIDTGVVAYVYEDTYVAHPTIYLSNTSLFVNDDWKATPSLTINAGVRWELDPAATVGPLGAFALVGDNTNPQTFQAAVTTKPLYATVYSNFAPRFGFAWAPHNHAGTVIRGGAGVYFDTGQAATTSSVSSSATYPYVLYSALTNVPYTSINFAPLVGSVGFTPEVGLSLNDPHLLSPRTYEWSLTLDQRLGRYATLTTSYVGNDGEKLIGNAVYYNAKSAAGTYPVNTTYVEPGGSYSLLTNQSHSNYQALQAQLTSRIGQQFTALVSYTWEHAEDNGSSDFSSIGVAAPNPIANSANDIPQMFAAAIHYSPQGIKRNRLLRAVTGGWGLDTIARLQSAAPITVQVQSTSANFNSFTTNADVINGVPTVLHEHINPNSGAVVPGNRMLNWAAFTSPPMDSSGNQLRNGDSPTNGYRLFGLKQWDLAASRTWKVWEGLNLNFRVDAYNVLNTVNFSGISSVWELSDIGTFGMSDSTYASQYGSPVSNFGASGAQLNTFQNGGPRELQLSMKLRF
jgi:hypothetical protein